MGKKTASNMIWEARAGCRREMKNTFKNLQKVSCDLSIEPEKEVRLEREAETES